MIWIVKSVITCIYKGHKKGGVSFLNIQYELLLILRVGVFLKCAQERNKNKNTQYACPYKFFTLPTIILNDLEFVFLWSIGVSHIDFLFNNFKLDDIIIYLISYSRLFSQILCAQFCDGYYSLFEEPLTFNLSGRFLYQWGNKTIVHIK